jgi:hypothetical protein
LGRASGAHDACARLRLQAGLAAAQQGRRRVAAVGVRHRRGQRLGLVQVAAASRHKP